MSWSAVIGHGLAHGAIGEGLKPLTTAVGYATNSLAPLESPTPELAMELAIRGWIDEKAMSEVCLAHGVQCTPGHDPSMTGGRPGSSLNTLWSQAYYAKQELPSQIEIREIANRQFWPDGRLDGALKRYGYYTPSTRQWVTNLRYDIPGPADLVRFSVRHVWEPDLLANIGYDQEFPGAIIDVWHAMKGLDYPLFTGPFSQQIDALSGGEGGAARLLQAYANAGISEPTWAKAYWWSHWVLPSPGMGYEFLFRLSPERDRSFDPPEAEGVNFTFEDLNLLLRANDYPPKYRPMLAAIAHRMPGVRFIRDFVKQGVYNYENLLEWARRWGYSPRDAKDIADDVWRSVQGQGQAKVACKGCATCETAYEVGVLTDGDLADCLTGYGASPEEAQRLASLAELSLRTKRAREVVSAIRKRYLRGKLSADEAGGLLRGYGLAPARVADYLDDWAIELEAGVKELSAAQAVKYACQGIISLDDLLNRLNNLGYPPDDRDALVAEATQCTLQLAERALAKQAQQQYQTQQRLYQAQRRARQQMIEAQQALSKHGSPNQLRKWFCEGAIGEPEVYSRLNFLGWPDQDITRLISDCKSGKKPSGQGGGGGGQGGGGGGG